MTKAQKSLVTNLVLLVVAGGIGAYAYFGVHVAEQEEAAKKDAEAKAFTFEKKDVKKLVLTAQGETTALERDGDTDWRIVEPLAAKADRFAVDAIVDKLNDLKSKAVIADDQANAAAHGLDHPTFVVRLGLADGKEHELQVGRENPFDKSLPYVKSGDGRIFATDGGLRWSLDKSRFDLRDKALVSFRDEEVQGVEVKSAELSWAAERDGPGWKLVTPLADKGDKTAIESVLSKARLARARAFPADAAPADLTPYGLDAPKLTAAFLVGADKARTTLAIGEVDEGGTKKLYARIVEGGPVAEVDAGLLADLTKKLDELRDRTVASFARDDVRRIELLPAEGTKANVVRKREKPENGSVEVDRFHLADRPDEKLREWKLTSALHSLSNLKGAAIAAEKPADLEPYGLHAPKQAWALYDGSDRELVRVLVGGETSTRSYVMVAGGERVFEVEKSFLDSIPKTLDDLLEKPPAAEGSGEASAGE